MRKCGGEVLWWSVVVKWCREVLRGVLLWGSGVGK